jgi:phosphoribosyl 1,2-cyclic phosphate phosphodiesterase
MCHDVGLHEEVNKILPEGFELAFDGQVLEIK